MGDKVANIVYQTSDFYAPYAGISICSLFENNRHFDGINVYLLNDHIGEKNKEKFQALAKKYDRNIIFIDMDDISKMLKEKNINMWKDSYATYYKMFIVRCLPDISGKILYIDSDTIVNGKIDNLLDLNMESNVCAMTQDVVPIIHKRNIGMDRKEVYYNAGVILFDVHNWKSQCCENRIIQHLTEVRSRYSLADQDILNVLFSRETKRLGPEYNFNPGFIAYGAKTFCSMMALKKDGYYTLDEVLEKKDSAIIYHYLGGIFGRPWEIDNKHPLVNLWDHYMDKSPWKGYEKIVSKKTFMTKVQRILFNILPKPIFAQLYHLLWSFDFIIKDYVTIR